MRTAVKAAVVGLATVLASACSDRPSSSLVEPTSVGSRAPIEQVARGLALAMSAPEVRVDIRNAMRASPYVQHKLILQEFVGTPEGQRLLQAAAEKSGVSADQFAQLVAGLPRMDFYLPLAEHRTRWRGEGGVAVVTAADARTLAGFTSADRPISFKAGDFDTGRTTFYLMPDETDGPEALRLNRQANVPGEVIEDFGDGRIAVSAYMVGADGKEVALDLGNINAQASPTIAQSVSYTWMKYLRVDWIDYDAADSWPGTMEIEVKSVLQDQYNNTVGGEYKVRFEGLEPGVAVPDYRFPTTMATWIPRSYSDKHRVQLVETDSGGDDHLPATYYYLNHSGINQPYPAGTTGTASQLGAIRFCYDGYYCS